MFLLRIQSKLSDYNIFRSCCLWLMNGHWLIPYRKLVVLGKGRRAARCLQIKVKLKNEVMFDVKYAIFHITIEFKLFLKLFLLNKFVPTRLTRVIRIQSKQLNVFTSWCQWLFAFKI